MNNVVRRSSEAVTDPGAVNLYWQLCVKLEELGSGKPDYRTMLREQDYRDIWIFKASKIDNPELKAILEAIDSSGSSLNTGNSQEMNAVPADSGSGSKMPVILIVVLFLIAAPALWFFGKQSGTEETTQSATVQAAPTQQAVVAEPVQKFAQAENSTQPAAILPAQKVLSMHGSNTIGEKLAPALLISYLKSKDVESPEILNTAIDVERFIQGNLGNQPVMVELHAHGSSTSFKALEAGKADIGMASRPIKQEEIDKLMPLFGDLSSYRSENILALDGLAVIVHPGNAFSEMTSENIARLFSGEVKNWKELGGDDLPVRVFARDSNSGTWDSFKSMVLKPYKKDLTEEASRFESSSELSDLVAKTPGGIGFIGLPYVRQSKALAVAASDNTLPIYPTRFTVSTEDYPLSRRLYLYAPASIDNSWAKGFIEYALSDSGQEVVRSVGLIPQTIVTGKPSNKLSMPSQFASLPETAERLSINFRFLSGKDELDAKARRDIRRLMDYLEMNPSKSVYLVGFTDSIGSKAANLKLSKERAQSVERELSKYGINVRATIGLGPQAPVASNANERGRNKNRRVEVWLR